MQKLEERDTYTPTDTSHVRGNCGPVLNREETLSVPGSKTSSNNSDAALTTNKGQAGQIRKLSVVYVQHRDGDALMPCSSAKARHLLKADKARVVKRTPFTIRLTIPTSKNTQPIVLGVDSGYLHIGLSAITDKKEVYSAEVTLRNDIVKLNSERRNYRRTRRNRKAWYRKPRFLNRKKPDGWLAPSIQHKFDSHLRLIGVVQEILPVSCITIEVASFDIQKIKNPDITGEEYQQGEQNGFWNAREYVLHRDNHTCQHCKGKSRDPVLEVHHIVSRQIGGDRPDNLLTLCSTCHGKVSKGELELDIRHSNGFKAEMFMSTVRWMLVNELRERGFTVNPTWGYVTKHSRISLGLPKSHLNDAFMIAGGNGQVRTSSQYFLRQVRKCNRKLFRGDRSHIRNTAERFVHGFQRYDKVLWEGIECFIYGRRTSGYFTLRKLDGAKIHQSAKYSDIALLESAKTFLLERRTVLLPTLSD